MELSHHFKVNKVEFSDTLYCAVKKCKMSVREYGISKGVSGADPKHVDDHRSICQMIRNVNGMSGLTYHNKFIYVVNFANNAVQKLNVLKGTIGADWGTPRPRSVFTEDKRELGISYLQTPHHSIFQVLSEIYDDMDNDIHKSYLEEVSYYFERINKKIIEYERLAK